MLLVGLSYNQEEKNISLLSWKGKDDTDGCYTEPYSEVVSSLGSFVSSNSDA